MNINEDKFENKSVAEIISDMLIQHKNNSKEALEHIQDILKDDGLTLSKDVKNNLKKAANILSNDDLKEGWLNNIISNKKSQPQEDVNFEVYLPFKSEPAKFVTRASSLEDPQVNDAIKKIRSKHPHSTIYIKSKLGNKTIREASNDYQVNLYTENKKYSCYVGTLPIALNLVEKAAYNKADILKENKILCSYDRSLKEWSTFNTDNELKEDIYTNDDITDHSYADLKKDITNLDERTKIILCKLNPSLIDTRRPKWHNTLLDTPKIVQITPEEKGEVLVILNGVENKVNKDNINNTELIITEKIPVNVTDTGYVYKNGEDLVITAKQFKDILNAEENLETLLKFEKSKGSAILNDEEASYFLELDKLAKQSIDARYPEWEEAHNDLYNLDNYTLPERAEIYQAWKDANRTTSFQQAHELTPGEIDKKFGLNKLKDQLKKEKQGSKLLNAFEIVRKSIPESEQVKLDDELLDILNNDETNALIQIPQIIGYYGAKVQLDQLSKGELSKIEKDLPEEEKEEFNNQLEVLITDKYVDSTTGLPKVAQNYKEALKDIKALINNFSGNTNSSVWNQQIDSVKEVGNITSTILNSIKEIELTQPKIAKELKGKFIGRINTLKRNLVLGDDLIKELKNFENYTHKVVKDVEFRNSEIAKINGEFSAPEDAEKRNNAIDTINNAPILKPDQEIKHENWVNEVKNIINPKTDEKVRDRTYYTAITNKISRLVKTDPTAANGYHNEFEKLLNELENKYSNPNNPKVEEALADFLATMKDETKSYGTLSKKLASAL